MLAIYPTSCVPLAAAAILLATACLPTSEVNAQRPFASRSSARMPLPERIIAPTAEPETWTLDEVTGLAESSHPDLEAAARSIEAARGRAIQARLYPNPMLATSSPQIAGDSSQYNVYATQDIVTAGKLRLSSSAAWREVEQSKFNYQSVRLQVVAGVRQQFYTALVNQRRLTLQSNLRGIVLRSLESANSLLEAGEGTKADVLLLEIEMDRAGLALRNLQVDLDVSLRSLAIAAGEPELRIDRVSGDYEATIPDFDLDSLRACVVSSHPDMAVAQIDTQRTQTLLQRARVEPIPNIIIMGGYQRQVSPPNQDQAIAQVMIEIPLWDRNQGNIRAARAEMMRSRAAVRQTDIALSRRVAISYNQINVASQRASVYRDEILPKARQSFDLTRTLYGQGQIDFLRLMQMQRTLIETELGYLDAQEARLRAAADLAALMQWDSFPFGPPPAPAARPQPLPNAP